MDKNIVALAIDFGVLVGAGEQVAVYAGEYGCRSRRVCRETSNVPSADFARAMTCSFGSGQRAHDLLEPVPLRSRLDFGLGVAECPNESGNPSRGLDVIGNEDVEIIAWSQHCITAEPFKVRTLLADALHCIAFKLLEISRRANRVGIQPRQHDKGWHGTASHKSTPDEASVGLGIDLVLTGQALANGRASPNNQGSIGETTYLTYCALCHGTGGAPGMFADALKKTAPDLTEIAKRKAASSPTSGCLKSSATAAMARCAFYRGRSTSVGIFPKSRPIS